MKGEEAPLWNIHQTISKDHAKEAIMIAIYDRIGTKYTESLVIRLLKIIRDVIGEDDKVLVTRLGGNGTLLWHYELKLDCGELVSIPVKEIIALASEKDAIVNLLHCRNEKIRFGVFDGSYMYVETNNDTLNNSLFNMFSDVKERVGLNWGHLDSQCAVTAYGNKSEDKIGTEDDQ